VLFSSKGLAELNGARAGILGFKNLSAEGQT
jgi:hypothetical protein